jgi:hypothetical protein
MDFLKRAGNKKSTTENKENIYESNQIRCEEPGDKEG